MTHKCSLVSSRSSYMCILWAPTSAPCSMPPRLIQQFSFSSLSADFSFNIATCISLLQLWEQQKQDLSVIWHVQVDPIV